MRIARREMHADIAGADRPQHRVGQGVETDIGVGMAGQARVVRDLDAAYANLVTSGEGVRVESLPDANIATPRRDQPLGRSEILRRRYLEIVFAAGDHQRRQSRRFRHCGVVGQLAPRRGAMRRKDRLEVKALGRLRTPQRRPVYGLSDHPVYGTLDRIAQELRKNETIDARQLQDILRETGVTPPPKDTSTKTPPIEIAPPPPTEIPIIPENQ